MTPKRKAYFAKCSDKEKWLRCKISAANSNLAYYKDLLTISVALDQNWGIIVNKQKVKDYKREIVAYRHELHRLKGMDRVVVPKRAEGYIGVFVCSCGSDVIANYCPNCGRRILWEKVE